MAKLPDIYREGKQNCAVIPSFPNQFRMCTNMFCSTCGDSIGESSGAVFHKHNLLHLNKKRFLLEYLSKKSHREPSTFCPAFISGYPQNSFIAFICNALAMRRFGSVASMDTSPLPSGVSQSTADYVEAFDKFLLNNPNCLFPVSLSIPSNIIVEIVDNTS